MNPFALVTRKLRTCLPLQAEDKDHRIRDVISSSAFVLEMRKLQPREVDCVPLRSGICLFLTQPPSDSDGSPCFVSGLILTRCSSIQNLSKIRQDHPGEGGNTKITS